MDEASLRMNSPWSFGLDSERMLRDAGSFSRRLSICVVYVFIARLLFFGVFVFVVDGFHA